MLEFLKHIYKHGNNVQKTFLLLFMLHVTFNSIIFYVNEVVGSHYWSSLDHENNFKFLIKGSPTSTINYYMGNPYGRYQGITFSEFILWVGICLILVFCMKLFKTNK